MKKAVIMFFCSVFFLTVMGQNKEIKKTKPDAGKKLLLAEAACGECKFGMPGKSCDLAVRIEGRSYFVDGTNIDSHGDAHARDGFCEAIRKAEVQGEVINNRFKASYFKLISDSTEKHNE